MKARDFMYWFQGYLEIRRAHPNYDPSVGLSAEELKVVENHLNLVFKHEIDPSMPDVDGSLQDAHDGTKPKPPKPPKPPRPGSGGTLYRC